METKQLEVINFTNTDTSDYEGMWGGEVKVIKAGQTVPFPRFLAEHYAKHLAKKILIAREQDFSPDATPHKELVKEMIGSISVSVQEVVEDTVETLEEFEGLKEEEVKELEEEVIEKPKKKGRKKK